MSAEPLTCPYCNALVPPPPHAHEGQRVTCPRCEESFPLRGVGGGIQPAPGVTAAPTSAVPALNAAPPSVAAPSPSRNRLVAAVVLSAMAVMAATGLTFALMTQLQRRANDTDATRVNRRPIFPEPDDDPAALTVVPSKLDALGYLPPNTNLVLGIHVRRFRQSAAGRALLVKSLTSAREGVTVANLLSWTGLEVEELDHVVLGVRTEGVAFPRVVVVARARREIDRCRVREKLVAEEREGYRKGQTVFRFNIPRVAPEAKMWIAPDKRTMVIDLYGEFDDVPEQPRAGLDHLPLSVRDALTKRVDPGAILWLAAAVDDWKKMMEAEWFQLLRTFASGFLRDELLERLKPLRVVALSTQLDPDPKAQADFLCRDATAATALRAAIAPPDDKLPPGVTIVLADDRLTVQWKESLDAVLKEWAK